MGNVLTPPSPATRMTQKRRGVRLNSRVPVGVEWEDAAGAKFQNQAFTCVVGSHGCLVVLPENLPLEQRVRGINLTKEQPPPGRWGGKGGQGAEGWELGIELAQPPMDFWGLEL